MAEFGSAGLGGRFYPNAAARQERTTFLELLFRNGKLLARIGEMLFDGASVA